ncbi:zinc finger protein 846-like isoform X2 [Lineus longissimus]|uniref:zinc finger protein 846-like isoform X2 n=1 Tax=Lineus longissimus TaxID=88925 RepID=UPI00315DC12B
MWCIMSDSRDDSSLFQQMQKELQDSGAVLTNAWTNMFGIMIKYQMELSVKQNAVQIAEKELELRKKQLENMKPTLVTGKEELSKLQDEIQAKKSQLYKSQQDLSLKDRMFQTVQADLESKNCLLEKSSNDLVEKQTEVLKCRSEIESLKSELTLKHDEVVIKDNLLKKVQGQLMKENEELKQQIELERRPFKLEHQSLDTGLQGSKAAKKRTKKSDEGNAGIVGGMEMEDSPSVGDLDKDQPMCEIKDFFSQTTPPLKSKLPRSRMTSSPAAEGQSKSDETNGFTKSTIYPIRLTSGGLNGDLSYHVTLNKSFEKTSAFNSDSGRVEAKAAQSSEPVKNKDSEVSFSLATRSRDLKNNHECRTCSKFFPNARSLQMHARMHRDGHTPAKNLQGRLDWRCQICGVVYRQRTNLKSHMMTHTGERPFACSRCGKAFRRKDQLKEHINIHTGEKTYTCEICGKCFTQRGTLNSHMRNIHNVSPHKLNYSVNDVTP